MSNTPSDAEIEKLAAEHLKAFSQFPMGGQVWFEGEVEFARAVLAKWAAPQQEPAFWTRQRFGEEREFCEAPFTTDWTPLYTAPQPVVREPLTDAQIAEMMRDTWGCASIAPRHALEFARAVERAAIAAQGGK